MKLVALFGKPPQWNPGIPSNLRKQHLYKDIVLKKPEVWELTGHFRICLTDSTASSDEIE